MDKYGFWCNDGFFALLVAKEDHNEGRAQHQFGYANHPVYTRYGKSRDAVGRVHRVDGEDEWWGGSRSEPAEHHQWIKIHALVVPPKVHHYNPS